VVVAGETAQEAFKDTCARLVMTPAAWTPNGSIKRAVDLYLAAMRYHLESNERSWAFGASSNAPNALSALVAH
jgi:hypothetical protein